MNRASPQALGLAAAWPLFAGPGLGLRDLSGNGAHLTLGTGAETPTWAVRAGLDGYALDFDGGDEAHVASGNVAALDLSSEITIALTIGPNLPLNNNDDDRIISKRTTGGGSDVYALIAREITSDLLRFRMRIGGSTHEIDATMAAGYWCGTYDGARMRLYRNGVQAATKTVSGTIESSTRAVHLGKRDGESRYYLGDIKEARIYNRALSAREVFALYDPGTRWNLYREARVPRVWPAAPGGAAPRTAIGSLQAAVQRQLTLPVTAGAALMADSSVSATADAGLEGTSFGNADLDLVIQALGSAEIGLDAALRRLLSLAAGLDASLGGLGTSVSNAVMAAAILRLNLLSAPLDAALRAGSLEAATLDAWLALSLDAATGLDAVARRGRLISGPALQAILRASLGRATGLDAVIGMVATAAASRTLKLNARDPHRVRGGQRSSVVPPGNRRH